MPAGLTLALAELMERWFNNKPTVLDEGQLSPGSTSEELPIHRSWVNDSPKKKKARLIDGVYAAHLESSDVSKADMLHLFADCIEFEVATTWVPLHANCTVCKGYCFARTSDVARQFGVCGCVIAMEMEIAETEARHELVKTHGGKTAWSVSEICSGTVFPIEDWPAVAEVLVSAMQPESQQKKLRHAALRRRQLTPRKEHVDEAVPVPQALELILPGVKTHAEPRRGKRGRGMYAPKRAHFDRDAPQAIFYHRLGRRKM